MTTPPPGTDWAITTITKVTDGDSLRCFRRRTTTLADGLQQDVYDTSSVAIRLITLDTPERGQAGYTDARDDVLWWLSKHPDVRIETWQGGGFDRLLGDVYDAADRTMTLSQWMLRYGNNGQGWLPYVRGQ